MVLCLAAKSILICKRPLATPLCCCRRQAFKGSANIEDEANIDVDAFTTFCRKTPEVTSWIHFFGAIPEVNVPSPEAFVGDSHALHITIREKEVREWSRFI